MYFQVFRVIVFFKTTGGNFGFLLSLTYSTPCYLRIIWLTLPQYFWLQYILGAAGTKLDSPQGVQHWRRLQASHRFLDSYEALIAHAQQRRKLTILEEETERGRRGRERVKTERQGQYNERRDSRSAHHDGPEETLCGSQVSTQLLALSAFYYPSLHLSVAIMMIHLQENMYNVIVPNWKEKVK